MLSPKATFEETIACAMMNETARAITRPSLFKRQTDSVTNMNIERTIPKAGSGRLRCWECDELGHISRDCRRVMQGRRGSPHFMRMSVERSGQRSRNSELRCWVCDRIGHISRDCWYTRERRRETPTSAQTILGEERTKEGRTATVGKVERLQVSLKGQKLASPSACPTSYIPVKSLARSGSSVVIKGDVNGRACVITLDTGATHTIVREDMIEGAVQLADELKLRMANGDSAMIKGKMIVNIRIGKTIYQHEALIADIVDEVILGMDFMRVNGFVLDFERGMLKSKNTELPLKFNVMEAAVRRVSVRHREELPSKSQTLVEETKEYQAKQLLGKKYRDVRREVRVSGDWMRARYEKQTNGGTFAERRWKWNRVAKRKDSSSKLQPTWMAPYNTRKGQGGIWKVVQLRGSPYLEEVIWALFGTNRLR